jgi:hypothetical protein
MRREGVKRGCAAFGLPREAGECEGAECSTNRACGKARFAGRGPRSRGAVSCAEETWPDGIASGHGTPEERGASVPPAAQRLYR